MVGIRALFFVPILASACFLCGAHPIHAQGRQLVRSRPTISLAELHGRGPSPLGRIVASPTTQLDHITNAIVGAGNGGATISSALETAGFRMRAAPVRNPARVRPGDEVVAVESDEVDEITSSAGWLPDQTRFVRRVAITRGANTVREIEFESGRFVRTLRHHRSPSGLGLGTDSVDASGEIRTLVADNVPPYALSSDEAVLESDPLFLDLAERLGGSVDVSAGVIDSGVDYHHVALRGSLGSFVESEDAREPIPGRHWDFVDNDPRPYPTQYQAHPGARSLIKSSTHGTHVTSLVIVGAPHARVLFARVGPSFGALLEATPAAVDLMARSSVPVANMSFLLPPRHSSLFASGPRGVTATIEAMRAASSTLFVISAGNEGAAVADSGFLGTLDVTNRIVVTSHSSSGALSKFGNFSATHVHIAAPGEEILGAVPGDSAAAMTGTSMAAPRVTNTAIKILGLAPHLSHPSFVRAVILESADQDAQLTSAVQGGRRLNSDRALRVAYVLARIHSDGIPLERATAELALDPTEAARVEDAARRSAASIAAE